MTIHTSTKTGYSRNGSRNDSDDQTKLYNLFRLALRMAILPKVTFFALGLEFGLE